MIVKVTGLKCPEFELYSEVITMSALDDLAHTEEGNLFFMGLFCDDDSLTYQLFMDSATHKWYAVRVEL